MKKYFMILILAVVFLFFLINCSNTVESKSEINLQLNLNFPEDTNNNISEIEVVTVTVTDNSNFNKTINLEISENHASGSIDLEFGTYDFNIEAGKYDSDIFKLLYFGKLENFNVDESTNEVEINLTNVINATTDFSGTPISGEPPLSVEFTDLSIPGTFPITEWLWDFGDGNTITSQNPSHIYNLVGDYTVSLTVTTSKGSDQKTETDYINVIQGTILPTADFSATPTSGIAPLTVVFSDLSSPGSSPITNWLWDFGDGNTITSQNPSHIYDFEGDYTVSLAVTTSDGSDQKTETNYITVAHGASITITEPSGGEEYSLGDVIQIRWNSQNSENYVKISLYENTTYSQTIDMSTTNEGIYNWAIPFNLDSSDFYRIRINSTSNSTIEDYSNYFTIAPGSDFGSILFVDDDGSIDIGHTNTFPQYEIILNAYGATWDYYEIELSGTDGPDAALMANYDLVIWECGEQWTGSNTLTVNDEAALATYLDAGGYLILNSHDYFYDRYFNAGSFSAGQFPYDYLGVESTVQDAFTVGVSQGGPEMVDIVGQGATAGLTVGLQDIFSTLRDGVYLDYLTPNANGAAYSTYDGNNVGIQTSNTIFTTAGWAGLIDGTDTVLDYTLASFAYFAISGRQ